MTDDQFHQNAETLAPRKSWHRSVALQEIADGERMKPKPKKGVWRRKESRLEDPQRDGDRW